MHTILKAMVPFEVEIF